MGRHPPTEKQHPFFNGKRACAPRSLVSAADNQRIARACLLRGQTQECTLACAATSRCGSAAWHRQDARALLLVGATLAAAGRGAPRGVRMAQTSLEDEAAARAFLAQPGPRAVVFAVNSLAPLALICSAEGCTVATCDANEDDGEEAALALGATSLPWVS